MGSAVMFRADRSNRVDSEGEPVSIRRVGADQRREALAVLLTGRRHVSGGVINNFLDLAHEQHLVLDHLWAVYRGEGSVGAVLLVPGAGRTAMAFVSPIHERSVVGPVGKLVASACSSQNIQQVKMIQAILDPGQYFETQALVEGGFIKMTHLQYMRRSLDRAETFKKSGVPAELLPWDEQRRGLFAGAILSSYEGTLDCPGLLGLRHIDDIIDSHMATGRFVPELWTVAVHRGEPIAVMLINLAPQREGVELVYFGVSPQWRRHGIGKKLIRFGLAESHRYDAANMILAVDENNLPAKQFYHGVGFVVKARKLAMILALASK